jgi:glutaredoxin
MRILILYTTLGCHLCEEAKTLLKPLLAKGDWQLQQVDIADSNDLMAKYGIRIPVLAIPASSHELNWPFTAEDITHSLRYNA